MNATGKKARRQIGGNRHDVKRARRAKKHARIMKNNKLTPEAYRAMKLAHKKALTR